LMIADSLHLPKVFFETPFAFDPPPSRVTDAACAQRRERSAITRTFASHSNAGRPTRRPALRCIYQRPSPAGSDEGS
jgi:hypothetical protein